MSAARQEPPRGERQASATGGISSPRGRLAGKLALGAVLLLLAAGSFCLTMPPAPALRAEEIAALADRAYGVYDRLCELAERRSTDCAGAAAALQAVVDQHRALLRAAIDLSGDPALLAEGREVLRARQHRVAALARRMERAFAPCADHPRMRAVLAQIE